MGKKTVMQKSAVTIVAAVIIGVTASVAGAEGVALTYRNTGWMLLRIPLPEDLSDHHGDITTTYVRDVWEPLGSALDPHDRIITLTWDSRLVSFDPSSGSTRELCVIDGPELVDLAMDPAGNLVGVSTSSSQSQLYWVDPTDCSLTDYTVVPMGLVSTIAYHDGLLFLDGYDGIYRFDPATSSLDRVVHLFVNGIPGMASYGGNLWFLTTSQSGGSSRQTQLAAINTDSGTFLWSAMLPQFTDYDDNYYTLEIIEQQPRPIPTLQPIALIVLVAILGILGILVVRIKA